MTIKNVPRHYPVTPQNCPQLRTTELSHTSRNVVPNFFSSSYLWLSTLILDLVTSKNFIPFLILKHPTHWPTFLLFPAHSIWYSYSNCSARTCIPWILPPLPLSPYSVYSHGLCHYNNALTYVIFFLMRERNRDLFCHYKTDALITWGTQSGPWHTLLTPSSASFFFFFVTFTWPNSLVEANPPCLPHLLLGSLLYSHVNWFPFRFFTTNLLPLNPTTHSGPTHSSTIIW